jgi:hypothetical protein
MQAGEKARWHVHYRLEKRHEDVERYGGSVDQFLHEFSPYEVIEGDGNILVNAGIALMLDLLIGAGGTAYNNAGSYIGVGDSSTAEAASQTDLQAATNKLRKAMDATYPSRSAQTVTWRSTFGSSDANFAWAEWAIFNGSSGNTMLNRKVQSFGTKSTGTWTLTVTVTIS